MKAIIVRFTCCALALWLGCLLFPQACSANGILAGSIMLTILYTILRPLLLAIILVFNLHLFGLLTPLADALFLLWTSAWVNGLSLSYWQSVAMALLVSAAYFPYSLYKERMLTRLT